MFDKRLAHSNLPVNGPESTYSDHRQYLRVVYFLHFELSTFEYSVHSLPT